MRFAPLVRVSTESQERQGESLTTQKQQIIEYVKTFNGTIPADCWQYSGQEHATSEFERKKLDQLLKDAANDKFDAIITCDASRWSRDNQKSKQGLNILRNNNIRFYVGTTEYDLYNPEACLFLGMSTEMNEFFAGIQSKKSIENRIARAKRGIPTGGALPYARTFDKETGTWGLDKEKVRKLKAAANDYLNGVNFMEICSKYGYQKDHLHKVFRVSCGTEFPIRFRSKKLNIDETVTLKVPRLLSKQMVTAIRARARANLTFQHGKPKNHYLLSRMLFCEDCGFALSGITINRVNKTKPNKSYRYYMHTLSSSGKKIDCDFPRHINADQIEKAVIIKLFGMFGDISGMEKAMIKAIPNMKEIKELRKKQVMLKKELKKVGSEKDRIVDFIAKGLLGYNEAKVKLDDIRDREALLTQEIDKIDEKTHDIPTEPQIRKKTKLLQRIIKSIYTSPDSLKKMSFADKRKLMESVFMGNDSDGKKLGVYLSNKKGKIHYSINGGFGDLAGKLPMTKSEVSGILGIPDDLYLSPKDVSNYRDIFYLYNSDNSTPFRLQGRL